MKFNFNSDGLAPTLSLAGVGLAMITGGLVESWLFNNRLVSIERQAKQRERLMMKERKGITSLELSEE